MKRSTRVLIVLLILLLNVASGVYIYRTLRPAPPGPDAASAPPAPEAPPVEPSPQEPAPETGLPAAEAGAPPTGEPAPPPGPAPAERRAVATLASFEGGVKTRSADAPEWADPRGGAPLYENDLVRTFEKSSARLSFGDGNTLEIDPNTLFVVRPPRPQAVGQEITLAALPGDLADRLSGSPAAEQSKAIAAEAEKREITIRPAAGAGGAKKARVAVRVLPDRSTGVEAVSGALEVAGRQGAGVTVREKMATRIDERGAIARPRLPLPVPALLSPQDGATYTFQSRIPRVELRWKEVERASEYRIVVASDPAFKRVFADEKVRGAALSVSNLPPGTYYWRVNARDAEGFVGGYSTPRSLKAVYDDSPPELAILAPRDMFVSPAPSVEIRGKTERAARVKVNGQKIPVGADGSFTHALALREGVNMVTIEAIDPAGNLSYGRRVITFKGGKRAPVAPAASQP